MVDIAVPLDKDAIKDALDETLEICNTSREGFVFAPLVELPFVLASGFGTAADKAKSRRSCRQPQRPIR